MHNHLLGKASGLFFLLLIILSTALAQNIAEKPTDVYVGIYLNQIFDVSLKDNRFSADFYIWFRWLDGEINPLETFEVVNGRVDAKEGEYQDKVKGYNYASCRVVATITKFWDVARFPLDNHTLTIEIEDSENEEFKLKYLPDTENCGINPGVQVPGWAVAKTLVSTIPHTYKTNYGDISLPTNSESVYARFIYALDLVRPGLGYFVKSFFTVFMATIIALIALFIKPTDLDPRFGLGAGALFAAVASEVVIASSLPETSILTLVDKLHIIAIFFIFITIAESIISLRLFTTGREEMSRSLDRICFYGFLAFYLALSGLAVII